MNVHLSKELFKSLQAMFNKLHNMPVMQSKLTFFFMLVTNVHPDVIKANHP